MIVHRFSLLSASLLLLAGCAAQGGFPSLAPRAVERIADEEPVTAAPVVPADAALRGLVAELIADARRGQAAFEAALPAAASAVSGAGPAGSEGWIAAQQAISRLEAARAPTTIALAALDRLRVERASRPINPADLQALLAAMETVTELARQQHARVDELRGSLSPI